LCSGFYAGAYGLPPSTGFLLSFLFAFANIILALSNNSVNNFFAFANFSIIDFNIFLAYTNQKGGSNMGIKYYKLFDLLNRQGMKKTDLLSVVSSPTLAKLSKGETVTTEVIAKICQFLKCQPGDIMEYME
jgi:DNA-binding Xre family transcriptional regulator